MFGRDTERAAIDAVLAAACSGDSGVLMFCGEPGIGKSSLLEYAAASATAMRVLRCTGVESELDLAYAGLHQLLRPIMTNTTRLPDGQRDAVRAALGLGQTHAPDRFLAAAGVLTLLSEAAERRPILCLVDDTQWIDHASTEVLAFVARRLGADRVGLILTTREAPWQGVPHRTIHGLGPEAGTALARASGGDLTDQECALLVEQTGGNPLALMELPGAVAAGQVLDHRPVPLTERLLRAFSTQVRQLSAPARRLLLISAADNTADLAVVARAAQTLDVPLGAWDEARRAGLVRIAAETVTFRHPLVRAAVYHGADLSERLATHQALADALDGQIDRRARHLAAATVGPNEQVAHELEQSGERARIRGGHAAAGTAFARAADLSPAAQERGRRLGSAALAAHDGGDLECAREYAHAAVPLVEDPHLRGKLTHVLARIELVSGSAETALPLFLEAAALAAEQAPVHAALMLSEATWAAETTGEVCKFDEVLAELTALPFPSDHPYQPLIMAHVGLGQYYTGQKDAGTTRLRQSLGALVANADSGRHLRLATMPIAGMVFVTGDHAAGIALGRASVAHCRAMGLIGQLPLELAMLAYHEMLAEHHLNAKAHTTEAMRLATDLGQRHVVCIGRVILSVLGAIQGNETSRDLITEALRTADSSHFSVVNCLALWPLGLLELSLGRPQKALEHFADAQRHDIAHRCLVGYARTAPDLVESAARAGSPARAAEPLDRFEEWVNHSKQPWARAVLHRSLALLATDDDTIEHHYHTAVGIHENAGPHDRPFSAARTRLLYGEWLRRKRRRTHARPQLLAAYDTFTQLDATAWARRAETELRATGETVCRPSTNTLTRLTPQELQVVRLAAQGGTNRDIAAHLFLSPRTVGYHLSKAFRKLGVASRHDLLHLNVNILRAE